jgi:hypothetical protein
LKLSIALVKICYKYELYKMSKSYLYPYTARERV